MIDPTLEELRDQRIGTIIVFCAFVLPPAAGLLILIYLSQ